MLRRPLHFIAKYLMFSTIISSGTANDSDSAIEESTPVSYLEITTIIATQFGEISPKLEMQDQSVIEVVKNTSPITVLNPAIKLFPNFASQPHYYF